MSLSLSAVLAACYRCMHGMALSTTESSASGQSPDCNRLAHGVPESAATAVQLATACMHAVR